MQGSPQLLPNKIWKQLDQYSNWKIISTKTLAGFLSKNQLNWEYNLRLNWFQNVRNESSRKQLVTIGMHEISQLLPNKFWKQLNQYSNWKILGTKTSAGFSSKNKLNCEYNLRINWFQNVRNESSRIQVVTIDTQEISQYFLTSFENNWTGIATAKSQVQKHQLKFRQKAKRMRNKTCYSAKFSVLRRSNVQSTELQRTSIKNFRFYWTSYQET